MSDKLPQKRMHSDIEFTNLGKINKANIKIRPFTVIAGCNSSGKSFITKSLYSLFSGVVGSSIESVMMEYRDNLCKGLSSIASDFSHFQRDGLPELVIDSIVQAASFEDDIERLYQIDTVSFNNPDTTLLLMRIGDKLNKCSLFLDYTKGSEDSDEPDLRNSYSYAKTIQKVRIPFVFESLNNLTNYLDNPRQEFIRVLSDRLTESMSDNFTVSSISQLIKFDKKDDGANIAIEGNGSVFINSAIGFNLAAISNIRSLNEHPPVYLESPIYWKLADALDESKKALNDTARRRQLDKNQLLSQVPKYFFDVMELLDDQVKTDVFSDIVQTIETAINGSLSINDGGIQYTDKESSASVSLSLTASGVTNLGMIALLLKRGAILPGTFLFIDEPEVHLHPAWQVVLVDVLHQLSKRGVNVVIASHSIDIMKAVENIMENDDEIDPQEHFGINQLTNDGYSVDVTENNAKRIAAIKQDLGKPFYDMFLGA